jgi:transposase
LRVRQERSQPLIVELEAWLCEQRAKLSKNGDTTKPINYCLSRWNAAILSLDDGAWACRTMPPKRELRSDESGRRAAAIYSRNSSIARAPQTESKSEPVIFM